MLLSFLAPFAALTYGTWWLFEAQDRSGCQNSYTSECSAIFLLRDRLRLAYLANPNSPSGTMIPPERVAEVAAALPCPLLVDEAYVDFADADCLRLVAENERVMVSRTLTPFLPRP